MKYITLLYPEEQSTLSTAACVIGTIEVFNRANDYWKKNGQKQLYQLVVAGTSRGNDYETRHFVLKKDMHISAIDKTDLIIIPSASPAKNTADNQLMLDWLRYQYKLGAQIASMCSGAFILASTGILDGKSCSTHWSLTSLFRDMFPKVNLQADKLITDEHGIYTNGGAYSFLNLLIYLVEKYYNRETAIYCSKVLQIELDTNSQSSFSIFTGQKQHGDDMVQQAQQFIEHNIEERISVEAISSRFAIGRRNFDRRFIKATGNTPMEYSQRVKIESAKKAFETGRKTVNEVMYDVGYSDIKAFREVFKKITGMSPLEYRSRYNRDLKA